MARLFRIAATTRNEELSLRACAELIPYRYPKLKMQETRLSAEAGAGVSVTINIGAADPVAAAIDVTPLDPLS